MGAGPAHSQNNDNAATAKCGSRAIRGRKEYTMSINEMFSAAETTETTGTRNLPGTAQLTSIAADLTAECLGKIGNNLEELRADFEESKSSHNAMDQLIAKLVDLDAVDVEFIKELDEQTVDGMLKSQQSKRSRAKSKTMTIDNYKAMMNAAICEALIRKATGKAKYAGGMRRMSGDVSFSEEELGHLSANQEQLRKELRNVQSKKSIMKAKEDFSEEDPRWQALLEAEAQLKSIRVTTRTTRVVEVDTTKEKLTEAFDGIDLENISSMKAADSKALLAKLAKLVTK